MSKAPPPSLLGLLAASNATKQSPDDEPTDADDTAPRPGVAAAQSILDALDDNDPEALADAFGAVLDIHQAGDEPTPPAKDKPPSKPALTIHIHHAA